MRVDNTRKSRPWTRMGGRLFFFALIVVLLLSVPFGFVAAQGPVPIHSNPVARTVTLNSNFDVNIIVEAGTNYVKSADLRLTVDRNYLRFTADATPGNQLALTNPKVAWLWNSYNNWTGNTKFAFMLYYFRVTGTFRICTLHLKAIQQTPVGSPALITAWTSSGAPMLCDRYGRRVPSTWINSEITVQ